MRFDIEKLERLKNMTSEILREQKKMSALSKRLGELDLTSVSQKRWGCMNTDLMRSGRYLERIGCGISALVKELGFNDLDPEVTLKNGWSEYK